MLPLRSSRRLAPPGARRRQTAHIPSSTTSAPTRPDRTPPTIRSRITKACVRPARTRWPIACGCLGARIPVRGIRPMSKFARLLKTFLASPACLALTLGFAHAALPGRPVMADAVAAVRFSAAILRCPRPDELTRDRLGDDDALEKWEAQRDMTEPWRERPCRSASSSRRSSCY